MIQHTLSVIGVGNMAKAIINGMRASQNNAISKYVLFDKNHEQYESLSNDQMFRIATSVAEAAENADLVLLSVKPQNYDEVLTELSTVPGHKDKLYISIGAGITVDSVSRMLSGARVVRVLPNVPMLIGQGVSLICKNNAVVHKDFELVCEIFRSAGSTLLIDEEEMNRMIGVTSSSPAYVFRFIHAIEMAAKAQGIEGNQLRAAICDVVIGSAMMLKQTDESTEALIQKVASKGGTTEKALEQLNVEHFDEIIQKAMYACTARANELGAIKKP